jgi:hypothetical protein
LGYLDGWCGRREKAVRARNELQGVRRCKVRGYGGVFIRSGVPATLAIFAIEGLEMKTG